eukprot:9488973-Pyramimonas_sp.AAC.2
MEACSPVSRAISLSSSSRFCRSALMAAATSEKKSSRALPRLPKLPVLADPGVDADPAHGDRSIAPAFPSTLVNHPRHPH